jgi:hypothetical protein
MNELSRDAQNHLRFGEEFGRFLCLGLRPFQESNCRDENHLRQAFHGIDLSCNEAKSKIKAAIHLILAPYYLGFNEPRFNSTFFLVRG